MLSSTPPLLFVFRSTTRVDKLRIRIRIRIRIRLNPPCLQRVEPHRGPVPASSNVGEPMEFSSRSMLQAKSHVTENYNKQVPCIRSTYRYREPKIFTMKSSWIASISRYNK